MHLRSLYASFFFSLYFCEWKVTLFLRFFNAPFTLLFTGKMTKDLAGCIHGLPNVKEGMFLHTEDFMEAVEEDFKKKMASL